VYGWTNPKAIKNIDDITAAALSKPDKYLKVGLANGVTSVCTPQLPQHPHEHRQAEGPHHTAGFLLKPEAHFGHQQGEVQANNPLALTNEVKRTNIFESKIDYPITTFKVLELGIVFALNINLLVYDL
jgi:hypothetical protein